MIKKIVGSILILSSFFAMSKQGTTHIYMAGDSTMSIKDVKDYPETGWGMPFSIFFNESVSVVNLAKNGRSTRTFKTEGLWKKIIDNIQVGDYVFIQFGHNDESKKKIDRYTSPDQFADNLTHFINDINAKKAHAILLTPITRRYFNKMGILKETHPIYADKVRQVSQETGVDFIDMEKVTTAYFQSLGDKGSALRFMHIGANLHPNYPFGVTDDTHLNQLGAREVAQLVLTQLKILNHPLVKKLRTPDPKHLKLKG